MSSRKRHHSVGEGGSDGHHVFSYEKYKSDLNSALSKYDLMNDYEDFWKFVRKFEKMKKGAPSHLQNVIPFQIKLTAHDLEKCVWSRSLSLEKLTVFLDIVKAYLNFKQLEGFNKVKAIRKAQSELPVAAFQDQITSIVEQHKVIIIAGDTGCGKSTQVPQYLLKKGFDHIVCTQPRRLACIALSSRLKYETLNEHTHHIGYQIRFERSRNSQTKVLFITEGLILRQIASDSGLSGYDVVILDEIHERHLQTDILLGLLKCLLTKRDDLKVVLMSATINIDLFTEYFGGAAHVVQVPGRLYPVDVQYRPVPQLDSQKSRAKIDATPYLQILQIIEKKFHNEKGDILIFLSGVAEITCLADAISEYNQKDGNLIVLTLHSALSLSEQDKVFDYPPDGSRKCIISTNIAETSVTIDGIRFVIDSGKVKEMSYDSVCKIQSLKEFWISRSSAEQRKGRAGRTGPGTCFRVYSEKDYEEFQDYTTPEIKRAPLDSVLLQVMGMGLPDARKFPFLEQPEPEALENCITTLKQQNALTEDEKITETGKMLVSLPVDITVGKMLIMGSVFQQLETTIALASVLSVQSPYTVHAFRNLDAENLRKEQESDHGDPVILLLLYKEWLRMKRDKEDSRKWCKKRGLEEQRLYEVTKLRQQFKDILTETGLVEACESLPSTSDERRLRHGEVKLLRKMKKDNSQKTERKRLKKESYEVEQEDTSVDIKDIEFRLRNDSRKVEELLDNINLTSHLDLTILKLIFCSGLYPRFAISDEFNAYKTDQVFHTFTKGYVFLHPQSYFGLHPSVLKVDDTVAAMTGVKYTSKVPFSSGHQILCYLNLLETNKIYLVNMLRMPAAQTFLLFANIDSSFNFSKLICDEWVLFEFLNARQAEVLMMKLLRLRKSWKEMVDLKLSKELDHHRSRKLCMELVEFLNTDIVYTMKRLLPADLKVVYHGEGDTSLKLERNPFHSEYTLRRNSRKGGYHVTDFLTYNSVVPNQGEDPYQTELFECNECGFSLDLNCLERMQHREVCCISATEETTEVTERKPNSVEFFCDVCKTKLYLTSIEILKHRRKCK